MSETVNIAAALTKMAGARPMAAAMYVPDRRAPGGYRTLSYAELDGDSDRLAAGLGTIGIVRGTRCVVMLPPGIELFVTMFALFKVGAVPVLIDPGLPRRALRACLAEAAPQVFIGVPLAHAARLLFGWARGSVRHLVTVGARWFWGGNSYADLLRDMRAVNEFRMADTRAEDLAAILFTSGSTGVPKGVEYQQRHFAAQVELLRDAVGMAPGAVNMPTFPPFALFDPALGMTSVIPDMDARHPARADPEKLIAAIERFRVDTLFGSPALLDTLAHFAQAHGITLKSIAKVISAGAPVAPQIVARMRAILPATADLFTPYGATECLPVSLIESREILDDTRYASERGAGTCVGRPLAGNRVRIIRIDDSAIADWSAVEELPVGSVGEITVLGPSSTEAYYARPAATALAKIRDGATIVHRMGDLGYFDAVGRLWFCGRKAERVQSTAGDLYTEQVEPIFNSHPEVKRSALVGIGKAGAQRPVLCVELVAGVRYEARERIAAEMANMAARFPHTQAITEFLFHPGFPVDVRHNAKIGRMALREWALRAVHPALLSGKQ